MSVTDFLRKRFGKGMGRWGELYPVLFWIFFKLAKPLLPLVYIMIACSCCRLEGDGEFTDTDGQIWHGMFHHHAAPGLRFKLCL